MFRVKVQGFRQFFETLNSEVSQPNRGLNNGQPHLK